MTHVTNQDSSSLALGGCLVPSALYESRPKISRVTFDNVQEFRELQESLEESRDNNAVIAYDFKRD